MPTRLVSAVVCSEASFSKNVSWTYDCIVLYLLPVLNPKSYDGARVLEASGRPWTYDAILQILESSIDQTTKAGNLLMMTS